MRILKTMIDNMDETLFTLKEQHYNFLIQELFFLSNYYANIILILSERT